MSKEKNSTCSFCSRDKEQTGELIASPTGSFICRDCVEICSEILFPQQSMADVAEGEEQAQAQKIPFNLLAPKEIKHVLDDYVIGQDYAKRTLSVAVYNHYKRVQNNLFHPEGAHDLEMEKSNVLLLGPSGCGKTLLAKTLAKVLDVPFTIFDATTVTEAGYVGEDVENIILRLIQAADGDIEKAQYGIIYVDEIDKKAKKGENMSITRDVSGEGVQQSLLKIIEGTHCNVPPKGGRKHPNQDYIQIDTRNILFICAGAFVGLEDVIRGRLGRRVIGFADQGNGVKSDAEIEEIMREVEPGDLVKYGLIPELIGRLPVISTLNPLKEEDLVHILTNVKNSIIKQYQYILMSDGIKLSFSDEALKEMAHQAIDKGTGARGLRSILEKSMLELMFELPSRTDVEEVIISKEFVSEGTEPEYILKKAKSKKSS
ncbi:ATP-dependent protease ATP-binding subunit [Lentisphaera araneosa HTCC2155]|uniref:ATP-dependent Clp protease ATP-binding subunit ClpX n=1 Tax=Lentisphaera araneosa HTCC2155 TaxID=313628 RepID=A6DHB9_9BACT|nr:ATP-dependent Clp protease ATP-binding subunit ClpX [Lentisphaera araneosa]EDM29002.1 ATP-dependent protease ATP-binding subunit [Lentisphaera araneosa HTCC2155]